GIAADGRSGIVRPEVARAQLERDQQREAARPETDGQRVVRNGTTATYDPGTVVIDEPIGEPPPPVYRRFYGSVEITDLVRFGREASKINEEILTHLTTTPGARVRVTIEIEADFPEGIEDRPRGIVQENAIALKFDRAEFERE